MRQVNIIEPALPPNTCTYRKFNLNLIRTFQIVFGKIKFNFDKERTINSCCNYNRSFCCCEVLYFKLETLIGARYQQTQPHDRCVCRSQFLLCIILRLLPFLYFSNKGRRNSKWMKMIIVLFYSSGEKWNIDCYRHNYLEVIIILILLWKFILRIVCSLSKNYVSCIYK